MGTIVISANVTLDGVVQDPDGEEGFERGGWFHQHVAGKDLEDWAARETAELLAAEVLLLGRRSSAWFASRMLSRGGAEVRVSREWSDKMLSIPKYVVSSTLEDPRWSNATILGGAAAEEISHLKQKTAGEILVYGSYRLVRLLVEQDLADELRLAVFPVVAGGGRRLFEEKSDTRPLELVSTRRMGEGLVFSTYRFRRQGS